MGSSTEPFEHLLSPLNMGNLRLKNRVVMASLTRNRDNVPRESLHVPYYSERAGTGLIVSQGYSSLLRFSFFVLL
jgi:2,4-dienoyl-CoA reductase-like NADH-dependent reductase (Old Yellow Enzyme family)